MKFFRGLLYTLPAVAVLVMIYIYGVNVITEYELPLIPAVAMLWGKTPWQLAQLWQQLNEHRPVVPLLLIAGLGKLTHWNMRYELLLAPLITMISFGAILRLRRISYGIWGLVVSLLLFSFSQWEVWLWGIVLAFPLVTAAFLVAVVLLYEGKGSWLTLGGAAVACLVASFSSVHGLFTWLAVAPLLLWNDSAWPKRTRDAQVAMWLFLASLTFLVYFMGYHQPAHHQYYFFDIPHLAAFILAFLGAPLAPRSLPMAILLGGIMVVSLLVTIFSFSNRKTLLPWICLALFAVITAAATAIGREFLGLHQALAGRYLPISNLSLIACLTVMNQRIVLWILPVIAFSVMVMGYLSFWQWQAESLNQQALKNCLESYQVLPSSCLGDAKLVAAARQLESLQVITPLVLPAEARWQPPANITTLATIKVRQWKQYTELEGIALDESCKPIRDIIVTYGPSHKLLAYTAANILLPTAHPICTTAWGWSVQMKTNEIADQVDPRLIQAWMYDRQQQQLFEIAQASSVAGEGVEPSTSGL